MQMTPQYLFLLKDEQRRRDPCLCSLTRQLVGFSIEDRRVVWPLTQDPQVGQFDRQTRLGLRALPEQLLHCLPIDLKPCRRDHGKIRMKTREHRFDPWLSSSEKRLDQHMQVDDFFQIGVHNVAS